MLDIKRFEGRDLVFYKNRAIALLEQYDSTDHGWIDTPGVIIVGARKGYNLVGVAYARPVGAGFETQVVIQDAYKGFNVDAKLTEELLHHLPQKAMA